MILLAGLGPAALFDDLSKLLEDFVPIEQLAVRGLGGASFKLAFSC
jgi:hypothetical protein